MVPEVQWAYRDNLDLGEALGEQGLKARRGSKDTRLVTQLSLNTITHKPSFNNNYQNFFIFDSNSIVMHAFLF